MIKLAILLARKVSLTQKQIIEHQRTLHAGLFRSVAVVNDTVRRYIQQHTLSVTLPRGRPIQDAVAGSR